MRSLRLGFWAIGAGVIRSLVWDELHGFVTPTPVQGWDVVFYDSDLAKIGSEDELTAQLRVIMPDVNWEVVNQASVHQWLQQQGMEYASPFQNLAQGIASWPEIATCVAVYLDDADQIHVIAPHGLDDLFTLQVRHNASVVPYAAYRERILNKQFQKSWPQLEIVLQD